MTTDPRWWFRKLSFLYLAIFGLALLIGIESCPTTILGVVAMFFATIDLAIDP